MDRGTSKQSTASSERNFCSKCSAMLWLYDDQWCVDQPSGEQDIPTEQYLSSRPELIMPFASAIDSELTGPEEMASVSSSSRFE